MEDAHSSGTKRTNFKSLQIEDVKYRTLLTEKFKHRKPYQKDDPNKLTAFIPGTIVKLSVKPGSKVKIGDTLLVLEAMKMKNEILSSVIGNVKAIHVHVGEKVRKDQLLMEFE